MKLNRFAVFSWGVLAYNIAVILWGAFVRATGSGAGCGRHWPACNGVVIPRAPSVETMIEFTHRATSGIAMLLVFGLIIWAFRTYPKKHRVRLGAMLSMVFIIIEALLGAGLVLLGLVADDSSVARAIAMAVHLMNTFILLGALSLTAWWASGGPPVQLHGRGTITWLYGIAFAATLFLGASGAIAALGNTLFPPESLAQGLRQDFSPTAHFLERLRIFHPIIAILTGAYLIVLAFFSSSRYPDLGTQKFAYALTAMFVLQVAIGAFNIIFQAPVWMQLVHLFMADIVWVLLVLTAATAFAQPEKATYSRQPAMAEIRAT